MTRESGKTIVAGAARNASGSVAKTPTERNSQEGHIHVAEDETGREYELKSVNVALRNVFTTHHHLNPRILDKYRQVGWVFAMYEGIELREVYVCEPSQLEPLFAAWEAKWRATGRDLNNPKIPIKFVRPHGRILFAASAIDAPPDVGPHPDVSQEAKRSG